MAESGGSGDYSALSPKEAPSAGCKSMQPEAGICEHGAPRRFRFNAVAAGAQRLMVMVQMQDNLLDSVSDQFENYAALEVVVVSNIPPRTNFWSTASSHGSLPHDLQDERNVSVGGVRDPLV